MITKIDEILLSTSEQIQQDLLCFLEAQLPYNEDEAYLQYIKDSICQIVVDNFNKITH